MNDVSALLSSVATLLWPVIFLTALIVLGPAVRELLGSLRQRHFTINVAGAELTVAEAAKQQRKLITDLQEKVIQAWLLMGSQPGRRGRMRLRHRRSNFCGYLV
jgi:hypothetical protein